MKALLLSGSVAGLIIAIGEGVLNAVLLKSNWEVANAQLNLATPADWIVSLAMVKLFVLGFVLMWLYEVFTHKYGAGLKSALIAGFTIGLLIWGWVLAGMWLAGYINNTIAITTFIWGVIELPLAAIAGARIYDKMSPA